MSITKTMRNYVSRSALVALTAAAISAVAVPAAMAQTTTSTTTAPSVGTTLKFEHNQQALEQEIIARQVQLAYLATKVADASNVTASDRTALDNTITSEQTSLAGYAANATAATTGAQLDTIRTEMITDERVYVVVSAETNIVIKADNDTVTEAGLTALVPTLTPLVTELGNAGASTLLANITVQVNAATSETTGVSAGALTLTPTGYPGNETQINTWNSQLNQAANHLAVANADVKAIEGIALNEHKLPYLKK